MQMLNNQKEKSQATASPNGERAKCLTLTEIAKNQDFHSKFNFSQVIVFRY